MSYHYSPFGSYPGGTIGTNNGLTVVPHSAPLSLSGSLTIACWFRTTKDYTDDQAGYMIAKGNYLTETAGQNINYALLVSTDVDPDNVLEFMFETSTGLNRFNISGINVNDGQWHHGVGRWNEGAGESTVFHNGQPANVETFAEQPDTNTKDLIIGGHEFFPTFVGDVDEVYIWNVALTDLEIENLYENGVVPQQGNIVYSNVFGGSGGAGGGTTTGSVVNSTIQVYHSGGSANADPLLDKGGLKSSVQINYSKIDNIFKSTDAQQDQDGLHDYRGVFIVNSHETQTLQGVRAFIFKDTTSVEDQILVGKAVEGKNEPMTAIALVTDAPPGVDFTQANSAANGILLGDLAPGEFIGIWLKRDVNEGTNAFPNNLGQLGLFFIAEQVVGEPGEEEEPPTESGLGWKFAAAADMSCGSTFANMLEDRIQPRAVDQFLALGDNAYSSGSDCWIGLVEDAGLGGSKSVITFGNHDVDEDEDQPETWQNLVNDFGLSGPPGSDGTWYGRTFNNVFFLVMNSEDNPEDNPQFDALRDLLEAASANPAIEWIFILHHRPIYGPDSNHANEADVRDLWDPIFDTNKVDFVLTAHNHLVFQTDLIRYDTSTPSTPIVVSTGSGSPLKYSYNRSTSNRGKIYMGVGNGGRSHYDADDNPSYLNFLNDTTYGYTLFTFSDDGKTCNVKQYSTSDTILNQFEVQHI